MEVAVAEEAVLYLPEVVACLPEVVACRQEVGEEAASCRRAYHILAEEEAVKCQSL